MKNIRTHEWNLHNGEGVVATITVPGVVGPNDTMKNVFLMFDQHFKHRLKYLCLSPSTQPDSKAFKHAEQ